MEWPNMLYGIIKIHLALFLFRNLSQHIITDRSYESVILEDLFLDQ